MKITRRIFDREYKLKVVELSYSRQNIRELAFEYEIRPELIYRWRSEFANLVGASFLVWNKYKLILIIKTPFTLVYDRKANLLRAQTG